MQGGSSRCGACAVLSTTDFHRLSGASRSRRPLAPAPRPPAAPPAAPRTPPGRKTDSARHAGPASRAPASAAAPGPGRAPLAPPHPRRRWLPPALRLPDAADGDARHDAVFRKVRGILNKLTPEKFMKLSDDLLALELDSDKVLKGVILLIFEKALDEPKYSSMYAQLCKRLSEEAPNLEPPGQPCTFKLLLLNKCRTEFENRAQAFAAFDEAPLAPDEEEKRHLAKCKMLGNIKFIGELGKLEILAESILHRCIQTLLARRAAAEHHEDLECLAQLVRTCGRVLDSARGRGLMDQYFARIDTLAGARELAPRIRFMLRDVGELRRGGWHPRAAAAHAHEGPVPIGQLRAPDERHAHHAHHARDAPRERERDALFRHGLRARPLPDVLAGLALQGAPPDKLFGNGARDRGERDAFRAARGAPAGFYPRQFGGKPAGGAGAGAGAGGAARGKARLAAGAGGALGDVQMRPAANSLLFSATRQAREAAPALQPLHNVLAPAQFAAPPLLKEPALALAIKPAPDGKQKPKKDKGVNKEEACRLAVEAVDALAERARDPPAEAEAGEADEAHEAPPEAARRLLELQLPDKVLRRAIAAALEHALCAPLPAGEADGEPGEGGAGDEGEGEERAWGALDALCAGACGAVALVRRAPAGEALRALLAPGAAHARLPALLAHAVRARLLSLSEAGAWCEGGAHHPLLLQLLQQLRRLLGMARLRRLFDESELNLCAHLPGHEAGGAGAAGEGALDALEARGLGALAPQLRVQAALARQLAAEPAPAPLYRWIKAHVEPGVRQRGAFVSALVALLARHVTAEAGSAAPAPDKAALEREKALAEGYAPLLTALLEGRADLQLAAVYAAQLHAHHHRYPKGMLLRWFMYLYNLEVCEEDAFLRWREDVTDAYPGKGEALFQVNTWLTWLQQQESEEDEAED